MEAPEPTPETQSDSELLARIRIAVDPRLHGGRRGLSGHLETDVRRCMHELLAREGRCSRLSAATVFRMAWKPRDCDHHVAWSRFAADARRKVAIVIVDIGDDMQNILTSARKLVENGSTYVSVLTSQVNFSENMFRELVDGMDLRLTDRPMFATCNERVRLLIPPLQQAA